MMLFQCWTGVHAVASIGVRKNGLLHFDFRYKGERYREFTRLTDTVANRRKMQKIIDKLDAEITLGTFDYASYFPNSKRAQSVSGMRGQHQSAANFDDFCEEWFSENEIRWKNSYYKNIRGILDGFLRPQFNNVSLSAISRPDILKFRADLARLKKKMGSAN